MPVPNPNDAARQNPVHAARLRKIPPTSPPQSRKKTKAPSRKAPKRRR